MLTAIPVSIRYIQEETVVDPGTIEDHCSWGDIGPSFDAITYIGYRQARFDC